jgi:hypothetical protein
VLEGKPGAPAKDPLPPERIVESIVERPDSLEDRGRCLATLRPTDMGTTVAPKDPGAGSTGDLERVRMSVGSPQYGQVVLLVGDDDLWPHLAAPAPDDDLLANRLHREQGRLCGD